MSTLSIRLSDFLHEGLRQMAEKEGVSMNQFIALALSEKISALHRGLSQRACSQG